MELAAGPPREIAAAEHRYQYIERQLKNPSIVPNEVIAPYALDVITRLAANGRTVVLQMDQSHINDTNAVPMLSVRVRNRALPVAWRACSTQGDIGFAVQQDLLDGVRAWLPPGIAILLTADRFYGTASSIGLCKNAGWHYRIRLKGNLTLTHDGGEITTGNVAARMPQGVENAELHGSGVITDIGVLHENGHEEPQIVAMDAMPSAYTVLDCGMRRGIESMFSDFKSRGFGITQSRIQKPDRSERLILIMAIALYRATSRGMVDEQNAKDKGVKRGP